MAFPRRIARVLLAPFAAILLLGKGSTGPAPAMAGIGDNFGYTVQSETFAWVDISGSGTQAGFPTPDNSFAGPIPIGFTFPFYENDYSSLYISTNGILTFSGGSLIPDPKPIPFAGTPNDFAAPLWDDLYVGGINSGKAYYDTIGTAPNRIFVVSYEDVTRASSPGDLLTFEVLMHENGDVCFQYASLSGDLNNAIAGIEDADGVDGIDQTQGIAGSTHFCFVRPPDAYRAKIYPVYNGGFVSNGVRAFTFTVANTGDHGTDTYDLDYSSSAAGWTVDFFLASTLASLPDTNGNSIPDTGPIPEGGSVEIGAVVISPEDASSGDWTHATLTTTSQNDPGAKADTLAAAAVPPSFSQLYQETGEGLRIALHTLPAILTTPDLGAGSIGNITMAVSSEGNHHVVWENVYLNNFGLSVTDIDYSVTTPQGTPIVFGGKITHNFAATLPTRDFFPAAATNTSGRIGVVFIRNILDIDLDPAETNSNVFLAVLNADGSLFTDPVNLTNNPDWRAPGEFDVPVYETPRIASVGTSFMVTWIENQQKSTFTEEDDVRYAVVTQNGSITAGPATQAKSTAGVQLFLIPTTAQLSASRALLSYTRTDEEGVVVDIRYGVRDSTGAVIKPETVLAGAVGTGIDAVEFSNGNILVAWIGAESGQVEYAVLNSSYNLIFGPAELATPDGREALHVSVTSIGSGSGALTWMDGTGSQNLYYALVGSGGGVLTPPMAFRSVAGIFDFVATSSNGGGNGLNQGGLQVFLPLVNRE